MPPRQLSVALIAAAMFASGTGASPTGGAGRRGGVRVAAVSVQDRTAQQAGSDGLDQRLTAALESAGIEAVLLRLEAAADIEQAARLAGCTHILYTDIVEITRPAGRRLAHGYRPASLGRGQETVEAVIEFRLFALDRAAAPAVRLEAGPAFVSAVAPRDYRGAATAEAAAAALRSAIEREVSELRALLKRVALASALR